MFNFQLLDLRSVIARMLGMNVTNLAVPDYEIISRLEKLILANQANATTAVVLDSALENMEDGYEGEEEEEEEEEEMDVAFENNHDLIGVKGIIAAQKDEIEKKKVSQ